jgi:hypothetical protein
MIRKLNQFARSRIADRVTLALLVAGNAALLIRIIIQG